MHVALLRGPEGCSLFMECYPVAFSGGNIRSNVKRIHRMTIILTRSSHNNGKVSFVSNTVVTYLTFAQRQQTGNQYLPTSS